MSQKNRIRAYTRWSSDRAERIEQAKAELSAALCVQRLGEELPQDLVCWSNKAFDVLEAEQVPMSQWGRKLSSSVMSIPANIAARQAAETVIDLVNGELRTLIDQHGQDALAPFFATLRECYGVNLTVEKTVEVERAPRGPRPMTDGEARAFEKKSMPWGKHRGKLISEVPVDYLQWVLDQPDTFKVEIERYLASEWVRKAEGEQLAKVANDAEEYPW